jgi:hypothetical protein
MVTRVYEYHHGLVGRNSIRSNRTNTAECKDKGVAATMESPSLQTIADERLTGSAGPSSLRTEAVSTSMENGTECTGIKCPAPNKDPERHLDVLTVSDSETDGKTYIDTLLQRVSGQQVTDPQIAIKDAISIADIRNEEAMSTPLDLSTGSLSIPSKKLSTDMPADQVQSPFLANGHQSKGPDKYQQSCILLS